MKKIVTISLIIQVIIIISWFIYLSNKDKQSKIENNIVQIIKKDEISKINQNPLWLFDDNHNLEKNIFSGFFITKNTIITVEHWVNSVNSEYLIKDIFWNKYNWELIYKNKELDYALIKIDSNFNNFYKYNINDDFKIWDEIKSISLKEDKLLIKKWKIEKLSDNKIHTDIYLESWDSWWILIDSKNNILAINNWYNFEEKISISTKIKDIIEN